MEGEWHCFQYICNSIDLRIKFKILKCFVIFSCPGGPSQSRPGSSDGSPQEKMDHCSLQEHILNFTEE